ncbi:MAG: hypothetical protein Q8P80_00720 [Candidatus Levybacteria bacterium]|nr:hypothetical protein [Candidatus Levybacteria bacterium]
MALEALNQKGFLPQFLGTKKQEYITTSLPVSETPGPKILLLVLNGQRDNLELSLKTETKQIDLTKKAPAGTKFSIEDQTKSGLVETDCKDKGIKIPNGIKCDDKLIFFLLNAICRLKTFQEQEQLKKPKEASETLVDPDLELGETYEVPKQQETTLEKAYRVLEEPEDGAIKFVERYRQLPFKGLLSESKFSDQERQTAWEEIARQERKISQLTLNMIREMLPTLNPIPNIRDYHQLTNLVNSTSILRTDRQIFLNIKIVEGRIGVRFSLKKEEVKDLFSSFLQKQIQPMRIYPTAQVIPQLHRLLNPVSSRQL